MDIQGRIRELMEERSWTEYRLAKEANLSHSTVANMFNRNNAPTFPTLEAICNAFQMTLSQFFCEDGNLIELTDEEKELISRWKHVTDLMNCHRFAYMNCHQIDWFSFISQPHRAAA